MSDDEETSVVSFSGKPATSAPLSIESEEVKETPTPVSFGELSKGKGKKRLERVETLTKPSFGKVKSSLVSFEMLSFAQYAAMLEKGTPCPLELVRDEDREFAEKFLNRRNAEKAGQLLPSPERQQALGTPIEKEQQKKKKGTCSIWWWVVLFPILVAVLVMTTIRANYIFSFFSSSGPSKPLFQVLPLYNDFPTADRRCLPVTPSMYKHMKQSDSREWDQLTYSLEHYMNNGFLAFSAFRLGKPYCYMLARDSNNQTIAMINPQIVGVNLDTSVMREERSLNCLDRSKHVTRYRDVWVRYQDPESDFDVIERKFSDRKDSDDLISFIFQSEYNYLNGRSICDHTEKGADSLLEILREGRSVLRPITPPNQIN